MNGRPDALRLSELLSARLPSAPGDDVAAIVLGPRLRDLCAAIGAPVRDWFQISRWVDRPDTLALAEFGAYVDVLVADRCFRPGDDLISDLIAYEVDDQGLTANEIREIVAALVVRGTVPVGD